MTSGLARLGFYMMPKVEIEQLAHREKTEQTHQNVHFVEHSIRGDQIVCYTYPVWFHRMAQTVCVRPNIRYESVS